MKALFMILGWFIMIIGIIFAKVFSLIDSDPTFVSNTVPWIVAVAGLIMILYSGELFDGNK